MERYQRLHSILSCLRNGSMTAGEIAEALGLAHDSMFSRLEPYRFYGWIFKRKSNKNPFQWALTENGKKRLEKLDIKFAPEKTIMIDLTEPPYCDYKKVIIKNGKEETLEIKPKIKI